MPPRYCAKTCLIKRSEKPQSIVELEKRHKKIVSNKNSERDEGMNHSTSPVHVGLKQDFSLKFTSTWIFLLAKR